MPTPPSSSGSAGLENATPFDIAALPYFPASPGLAEWLSLALIAAGILLYGRWRLRRPVIERVPPSISRQVLHDVNNVGLALEADGFSPESLKRLLAELSISVRRAVPPLDGASCETLGRSETLELLAAQGGSPERALLQWLCALEQYKFVPDQILLMNRERVSEAFAEFRREAEAYFGRSQAP